MCACYTENTHHGQTKDDTFLCIPPLYHTGAKMHWFGSFLVGGKAILLRGTKPEWILKAVSDEYATIVWLLVPWAQDILDAADRGEIKLENYRLSQWRLMHIGAQPVPPSLIKRWKTYFPNHSYDTNYGLSEAIGPDACISALRISTRSAPSARRAMDGKPRSWMKKAIYWPKMKSASLPSAETAS
jgi:acyl-CoA synthetase (AMP-forming)/AMP-acid ligase II